MRQLAMAIATVLAFAMISPAFAQPFADTPTNHWAYDAIAELAAKGLVEGYPDGTFKGDRAMTRYEMAMVVARLLARIESIQIPTPAPAAKPEVTGSDIQSIQRLVNEFRAELAAKNVRLTAVEEELNAMKAKLSNVRITGGLRFREELKQKNPNFDGAGVAPTLNGNPLTSTVSATTQIRGNRPRIGEKIGFDGSVAPDLHFILAVMSQTGDQTFNSSNTLTGSTQGSFGSIDSAFLDYKPPWLGGTTEIWLGRFGQDSPCGGGCYPLQFGPFGLLFNTGGDTWEDSTGGSGNNAVAGTGFTCPALGNGWGAYAQWDVMSGIHLDVEAAQWLDRVLGGTDSGYQANAAWDLSNVFHICCSLTVNTGYAYFGPNFYTPYGAAEIDINLFDYLYPGNAQGFTATASIKPVKDWTISAQYLTGNNVSNQMTITSWEAKVAYAWSANAKITFKYGDLTMGGVDQANTYKAEITYSF